jgi:DNA-binding PucR family transcriptional regulator
MPYESESEKNNDILRNILEKIAEKMSGLVATAALGGRFESLQDARKSYLQAIKVLRFTKLQATSSPIYAYEQLGIYKLLFEIEPDKLAVYYQEVIEPLNQYDRKNHMDLVHSLFVYLEENCNAAKTAKRLFVHRNTLDYRLKKIEKITGRSLDNPYERLTLQLGVIVGQQLASESFSIDD